MRTIGAVLSLLLAAVLLLTACQRAEPEPEFPFPDNTSTAAGYWEWEAGEYWATHPVTPKLSALRNEMIVQMATTDVCTYLLTESGAVFGCGYSTNRALAQNTLEPVQGLVKIDLPEKIRLICAAPQSACAVGESSTIYVWGKWTERDYGKVPAHTSSGTEPFAVPFDKEIADIDLYSGRVTILTTDGEVYAFGDTFARKDTPQKLWDG